MKWCARQGSTQHDEGVMVPSTGLDPTRGEPASRGVAEHSRRIQHDEGVMVRSTGLEPVTLSFEG